MGLSSFRERLLFDCQELVENVERLKRIDLKLLTQRPQKNKWNVLEVINHLLLANEFYLEQIIVLINKEKEDRSALEYQPGWLGQYFAQKIRPTTDHKVRFKGKTFKHLTPAVQDHWENRLAQNILQDYQEQVELIIRCLNRASVSLLKKQKVKSTFSSWWGIEMGNAFDYMIGHNLRHFVQIQEILKQLTP